jgi:hypothetical protein
MCQWNPSTVPPAMDCSMSGCGSIITDKTALSMNPTLRSSHVMDKLDPRVDSEANCGKTPTSTIGCMTTDTTCGATNAGPHSSNITNKLDPRVDSDRSRHTSALSGQTDYDGIGCDGNNIYKTSTDYKRGTAHGHHTPTNAGPHSSHLMNKRGPLYFASTKSNT